MPDLTYYQVLGVSEDATEGEVKAAYRKAMRTLHPDRAGAGGEAMATLVNQAYNVLSDATKRADYNLSLRQESEPAPAPPAEPAWGSEEQSVPDYSGTAPPWGEEDSGPTAPAWGTEEEEGVPPGPAPVHPPWVDLVDEETLPAVQPALVPWWAGLLISAGFVGFVFWVAWLMFPTPDWVPLAVAGGYVLAAVVGDVWRAGSVFAHDHPWLSVLGTWALPVLGLMLGPTDVGLAMVPASVGLLVLSQLFWRTVEEAHGVIRPGVQTIPRSMLDLNLIGSPYDPELGDLVEGSGLPGGVRALFEVEADAGEIVPAVLYAPGQVAAVYMLPVGRLVWRDNDLVSGRQVVLTITDLRGLAKLAKVKSVDRFLVLPDGGQVLGLAPDGVQVVTGEQFGQMVDRWADGAAGVNRRVLARLWARAQ